MRRCGARVRRAFAEIAGGVWSQDGGADELSVTGNFKESVEIVMKEQSVFEIAQVKIMRNLPKTALLHLQKYRISVIMSIV